MDAAEAVECVASVSYTHLDVYKRQLSGPAILAAAAREAVKQWHFKPYLVNGQPVETQARVTVNFTISTN